MLFDTVCEFQERKKSSLLHNSVYRPLLTRNIDWAQWNFPRTMRSIMTIFFAASPISGPTAGWHPVADPECARVGGVSHILAEKRGVSLTLLKKCMKIQYFYQ